ncbi:MAG: DUF2927 domain-containing protein [Bradyrhizobium sp.]
MMTKLAAIAVMLAAIACTAAHAEDPDIASRRVSQRTDFTDAEIRDGLFKIAFNAELQLGTPAGRVRKFDEPVRIFLDSKGKPDRRLEIDSVIADIRARVNHLDVAVTNDRKKANFIVRLVAARDVEPTIRTLYGHDKARRIQQTLNPQCLSGIARDQRFRIRRAEVILPVDAGDFTFYDCAYEELLQALGAINDDRSVPWTMFNDDVQMGFFDIYMTRRLRPGMTKTEVSARLPEVMSTASRMDRQYQPAAPRRHPAGAGRKRLGRQSGGAGFVPGRSILAAAKGRHSDRSHRPRAALPASRGPACGRARGIVGAPRRNARGTPG